MKNVEIVHISKDISNDWLLNKHYAKRIPSVSYRFGCFEDGVIKGVITFGSPPSKDLCVGICGEKWKNNVIELNRLTLVNNHSKNLASYFVSNSMKLLPKPTIVVSYADTSMNHTGYIYQATNFIYTGLSVKAKEWQVVNGNGHSRSLTKRFTTEQLKADPNIQLVDRARKHRYIYFLGNKKQVKNMKKDLKYKIENYPKGENSYYENNKTMAQQMTFL
tara:strand:+ start:2840 stop:3496 length:657 start_codon:yes stop_codon:yes gene_type:complete